MSRIYKRSDRIVVRIDGITVRLAPLSLMQKTEIQQAMINGSTRGDLQEATRGVVLALKYSIKGMEGVEDSDGAAYKLEMDEAGDLTDECISDLFNLEMKDKLAMVCGQMVNAIPASHFTNEKNEALEGVEIVRESKVEAKKA